MDMNKLGWIGVGIMGSRMSRHLLGEDTELYVCDTAPENVDAMVKLGAKAVSSPAELAEKADIIFAMIPNGQVLKGIIAGENGLLQTIKAGQILVDMSTIDPQSSAEAAAMLEEKGVYLMRSPVSGSTTFAEQATLKIMTSGDRDAFERIRPFLEKIGDQVTYVGAKEEARYIKIAINMMNGNTSQMIAESMLLCEAAGLDMDMAVDLLASSAAASPMIRVKADMLKSRDYTARGTIGITFKDMNIALQIAHDKQIALPMTALSKQMYSAMMGRGQGNLDYYSLLMLNEEMNGIEPR